jgi:Ca-activated chloride channel family protein
MPAGIAVTAGRERGDDDHSPHAPIIARTDEDSAGRVRLHQNSPPARALQSSTMKSKTRTALILGAAGAAVATALVLDLGHAESAAPARGATPVEPASCGAPAPSHADAKLEHGKLTGALSAGKLARGGGGDLHAEFEIATQAATNAQRPPLDLAFVIDRSGSMSGDRLEHAKSAARGIVEKLGAQDHVALIQYDDAAQVVVSSLVMDDGGRTKMEKAIAALETGGSTNLEAGLELGRHEVERVYVSGEASRVMLLSDGMANVGIIDPKRIADTAREAANHGVRVTSVGIGLDFNEDLMESIAEAGRGNYHYVKSASDLDKTIAGELASVQATVATNVELRLTTSCGAQLAAVHGYESHKDGDATVVPMPDLFGGDDRKLLVSLRVPDATLGETRALHAELVYRDTAGGATHREPIDLGVQLTDDRDAAIASVDQGVMAEVFKLEAAESMRQAAQEYEHGNAGSAAAIIATTQHHIEAKQAAYKLKPAAAAEALGDLDEMDKDTKAYAPGTAQATDVVKATKWKARAMSKK